MANALAALALAARAVERGDPDPSRLLRPGPGELGELARRAAGKLRTRMDEAGQATTITTDPDARSLTVCGDADRLTQVITNLLVNALAHTPSGGMTGIDVRRRGDQVALTITDTGPGIPPAQLTQVFKRFYRGTQAPGQHGTGVGLAVVAELVHAHGGTVGVTSPPGEGAVFTVLLPAGTPPACPRTGGEGRKGGREGGAPRRR